MPRPYSRFNAWTFCWRLAGEYPIAGGGFETFTPELFQRYAPNAMDVHGPHSIYFGVLAEHGFIGLLSLFNPGRDACFASTHWIVKWAKLHGDETAVNYGNMFRFALVGFLISGFFLGRAYFDYYYTLIACIVVLRRVCKHAWSQSPEVAESPRSREHGVSTSSTAAAPLSSLHPATETQDYAKRDSNRCQADGGLWNREPPGEGGGVSDATVLYPLPHAKGLRHSRNSRPQHDAVRTGVEYGIDARVSPLLCGIELRR